jgi:hypothetical protein
MHSGLHNCINNFIDSLLASSESGLVCCIKTLCATSELFPTLWESVELIVEVLDDVLPLGRGEFLLCHVGAVFYLLL